MAREKRTGSEPMIMAQTWVGAFPDASHPEWKTSGLHPVWLGKDWLARLELMIDDAATAGVRRICLNLPGGSRENMHMESAQGQMMLSSTPSRVNRLRSLFKRKRRQYKGLQFGAYCGSWHQRTEWALGAHDPKDSTDAAYQRAAVYLPLLSFGFDFVWIDALSGGDVPMANSLDRGTMVQDRGHWQAVVAALKSMSRPFTSNGKDRGREVIVMGEAAPEYDELRDSPLIDCWAATWAHWMRSGRRGRGMGSWKHKISAICSGMNAWDQAEKAVDAGWCPIIYVGPHGINDEKCERLRNIVTKCKAFPHLREAEKIEPSSNKE